MHNMESKHKHTEWIPTGFEGAGLEKVDYIYEGDDEIIAGGAKIAGGRKSK